MTEQLEPYLLRPVDAARYLAISRRTLDRLIQQGKLPVVHLGDGQRSAIGIRRSALEEFCDTREQWLQGQHVEQANDAT